ncbi:hypothetical protein Agub_g11643, partial [Astrephomene gubernaculifera]
VRAGSGGGGGIHQTPPPRPRPGAAAAAGNATGTAAVLAAGGAGAAHEGVLRLLLCAVSYGQLFLADAVSLLCHDNSAGGGGGVGGGGVMARGGGGGANPGGLSWDVLECRRALLGPPIGLPGCYCRAEAAVRFRIQASLPLDLVWGCVGDTLARATLQMPAGDAAAAAATLSALGTAPAAANTAAVGDVSAATAAALARDVASALTSHAPFRHCLLSEPRALLERLSSPAAVQNTVALLTSACGGGGAASAAADGSQTLRLPQRLVVLSLMAGQLIPLTAVASYEAAAVLDCDSLLTSALVSLEPPCFSSLWLLLRLLVDEHALVSSSAAAEAASRSGGGGGGNSRRWLRDAVETAITPLDGGSITELRAADKSFCDAALGALLAAPGRAELLAEVAWQLGRGVGDFLVKSADWLLQDRKGEQLQGHTCLSQLVARLGRNNAGSSNTSSSSGNNTSNNINNRPGATA